MNRRQLIQSLFGFGLASIYPSGVFSAGQSVQPDYLHMPEESEPHVRTWMAFVARESIWSKRQIPEVKRNLIAIAATIAKYEPVSMLVSRQDYDQATKLLNQYRTLYPVSLIEFEVDDLWLRDTGPTFVEDRRGNRYGVNFNFNGWGEKQDYSRDAEVARYITRQSGVSPVSTDLVLEGGCF